MDGKGRETVDRSGIVNVPPVDRGDVNPPDNHTFGGTPGPKGGGMMDTASSDLNEFGFDVDTSATGMEFGMDIDMTQDIDISQEEIDQMKQDIFETSNEDLSHYEEEAQQETSTNADEVANDQSEKAHEDIADETKNTL